MSLKQVRHINVHFVGKMHDRTWNYFITISFIAGGGSVHINKPPSTVKTNIKSAPNAHPYNRHWHSLQLVHRLRGIVHLVLLYSCLQNERLYLSVVTCQISVVHFENLISYNYVLKSSFIKTCICKLGMSVDFVTVQWISMFLKDLHVSPKQIMLNQ